MKTSLLSNVVLAITALFSVGAFADVPFRGVCIHDKAQFQATAAPDAKSLVLESKDLVGKFQLVDQRQATYIYKGSFHGRLSHIVRPASVDLQEAALQVVNSVGIISGQMSIGNEVYQCAPAISINAHWPSL